MATAELTPTQRRFLKQLAHHLKPLLHIGKEGPSPQFIGQLEEQLAAHELIKIRVLNNCEADKTEIQARFDEAGVSMVQKVGHVYTVFKKREENSKIPLPNR